MPAVERPLRILSALVMVALVAGAAIVFVRAQELKSAPSPIIAPRISDRTFSPNAFKPTRRAATLTVGLRQTGPARVVIFDRDDAQVAMADMRQRGRRIKIGRAHV